MLAIIFICNVLELALICLCCYLVYKKSVTKITFSEKSKPGVFLMDAKHEKAIQDKMEIEE